jgi:DNA helicase HerA-like ATPase
MGLLGTDFSDQERLQLGHFVADRTAAAIASGDRFFQRHASILGSTGSGKSWSVALILERAKSLQFPNIIVLDMHGEYAPLTDHDEGYAYGLRVAGPGDLDSPSDDALFLPYWLLNREEMLAMILDRSDMNAPNQASRFTLHVRRLKEKVLEDSHKTDTMKTFTVDSPMPYKMDDLVDELKADNTRKGKGTKGQPVKGEWEGKLTRFISRLEAKLHDRRYGFLFQPPHGALEYDWLANQMTRLLDSSASLRGIKIVDFSEVPSDVLPVVTSVLVRLLYDVQFWMEPDKRTPLAFFCDEAHLYLPVKEGADAVQKQALESFERIAKEGRKYGVSLIVISQRPSDVSRTILSQCNNFLVLRLNNDRDQAVVRRLMPETMSGLTDVLPLLDTGEAVLLGDAVLLPSRIKMDVPALKPSSATRDFWTEWGSKQPSPDAIVEAVEVLRRQTRATV